MLSKYLFSESKCLRILFTVDRRIKSGVAILYVKRLDLCDPVIFFVAKAFEEILAELKRLFHILRLFGVRECCDLLKKLIH